MRRNPGRAAVLVLAALQLPDIARSDPAPLPRACALPHELPRVAFTGLNPAIERRRDLSTFAPGQVIEIDPRTMSEGEARELIGSLHIREARVSIYLVGGHCDLGSDCDGLKGAALGTTGSWHWDRSERRILDVTHPTVLARILRQAEQGWRLGANYIRVDNLHWPAGASHPRGVDQMRLLIDALHSLEDRLRAAGHIAPSLPTGLVAHNNLVVWERLIRWKLIRRAPVLLTSERTGQLAEPGNGYAGERAMLAGTLRPGDIAEISSGRRLARALALPYTIAEFQSSHDLTRPGRTYELPAAYVERLLRLDDISEVIVLPSESHYVGRGRPHRGRGVQTQLQGRQPEGSVAAAAECLGQLSGR